jgi:hypothetical protein
MRSQNVALKAVKEPEAAGSWRSSGAFKSIMERPPDTRVLLRGRMQTPDDEQQSRIARQ